jgi:hypothetical protein
MDKPNGTTAKGVPTPADVMGYWVGARQRSILFLDVMRQRAEQDEEHEKAELPYVLDFAAEVILDGRTLEPPVNFVLARILPKAGKAPHQAMRPFVVVEPRAGHGPGIGGFKADSDIGAAMAAGHPCYFVGFLPDPVPGQTVEDVVRAEAVFLERVIARHPEADGKRCVVANCQAGWQMMMTIALRPEVLGPIIVAGSPLSYWADVRGVNPMRYTGGLLGGSWLTALTGDLGAGKFDGAWLVQNFENLNPPNTYWTKSYNLHSRIDTEPELYLEFEKWWGGHVSLTAEELQFIVDELFIGNRLASGEIRSSDGTPMDLRNIRSPIVIFCSHGDNITRSQQALDWILDLDDSVDEIRACGQTIVSTIHDKVGHLGNFVSRGVARKEHTEFASNIDLIDVLPPGLYEAVMEPKGEAIDNPDLVTGEWVMQCEPRTRDDVRALGVTPPEDERRFATAAKVSDTNVALHRTFVQPWVRAMATAPVAEMMERLHPLRLQYEAFGTANPLSAAIATAAEAFRENRRPVDPGNPLRAMETEMSDRIVTALDGVRLATERASEATFLSVYGAPPLQKAMGSIPRAMRRSGGRRRTCSTTSSSGNGWASCGTKWARGGQRKEVIRALCYIGHRETGAEERVFAAIRDARRAMCAMSAMSAKDQLSLEDFKALVRLQFLMLLIDEEHALATLPALLPESEAERRAAFSTLSEVVSTAGQPAGDMADLLDLIEDIFLSRTVPGASGSSKGRAAPRRGPTMAAK